MDKDCSTMIAEFVQSNTQPPIILCVGTDKVSGDSLGPTVGTLLTESYHIPTFVNNNHYG